MKKVLSVFLLIITAFSLFSCAKQEDVTKQAVLTVNGEVITQAEIDYFKGKLRAEVLNDYLEKYSVQYNENFWQTTFDGKTPEQALEEKAREESIMAKIQLILMREEGIYDDITYEGLYKKAEAFNNENADKQGVVGIKTIKMSQFYSYYLQNGIMELKNIYAEGKLKPTQEEIDKKILDLSDELENSKEEVVPEDYENVAKDKLKTEKYEAYIKELRKNAEIKEVA